MRIRQSAPLLLLACLAAAGCSGAAPDTKAADGWLADTHPLVQSEWPGRLVAGAGGVVTQADGDGLVISSLAEAASVSEFVVACGGDGDEAEVSLQLKGAGGLSIADTVACTGDYETVGSFTGSVEGVTSVEFGFSAPGEPVGVSLVVLAP